MYAKVIVCLIMINNSASGAFNDEFCGKQYFHKSAAPFEGRNEEQ